MSGQSVYQTIDNYMDWLSDQPEAVIRRKFANQRIPRNVDFTWKIGGTEYIVSSHFNQGASEVNKIERLLENEIID